MATEAGDFVNPPVKTSISKNWVSEVYVYDGCSSVACECGLISFV